MRVFASYAASTLLHMAVVGGILCWFAPRDSGPVLMPGAGNGGGMNLDSDVGGVPGGNPLPTDIVYVQFHKPTAEKADQAAPPPSEMPAEPQNVTQMPMASTNAVSVEAAETPIERLVSPDTTLPRVVAMATEGPALPPAETVELTRPQRTVSREVEAEPELESAAPAAAMFSRNLANMTTSSQLTPSIPPVEVGTGAGGSGEGGGLG